MTGSFILLKKSRLLSLISLLKRMLLQLILILIPTSIQGLNVTLIVTTMMKRAARAGQVKDIPTPRQGRARARRLVSLQGPHAVCGHKSVRLA
jgi:hypothetical protein